MARAAGGAPPPRVPTHPRDATMERDPHARVVTAATPPHVVVDCNRAWLELCAFPSKERVVGRTLACIQGALTDRRSLAQLHAAIARGHPADATLVNYKGAGAARERLRSSDVRPGVGWLRSSPAHRGGSARRRSAGRPRRRSDPARAAAGDGTAFLNHLRVFPLYADPSTAPSHYLGILRDLAAQHGDAPAPPATLYPLA